MLLLSSNRYGTLFFAISGLTNPFIITVISSCCALAGSLCAFPLVKYFGRRILLLNGSVVCTLCMYLFAIVAVVKPGSIVASNFLVAAVCIYTFTYGATWGPVPTTIMTEIPSNGLRSKTMSMTACIAWSVAMLIACGTPYLVSPDYANIGAKLGFVFGSTLLICFIILIFVLPETKDRTLEEIDEMFLNVKSTLCPLTPLSILLTACYSAFRPGHSRNTSALKRSVMAKIMWWLQWSWDSPSCHKVWRLTRLGTTKLPKKCRQSRMCSNSLSRVGCNQ